MPKFDEGAITIHVNVLGLTRARAGPPGSEANPLPLSYRDRYIIKKLHTCYYNQKHTSLYVTDCKST